MISEQVYAPFSLCNKKILVTGASSGIGRAVAIECSKNGATVILTARDKARLEQTYNSLTAGDHASYCADLTDESEVQSLAGQVPQVDGIVHCAGIMETLLFQFVKKEQLQQIMEVNFLSPVLLTQHLLEQKKLRKNSSIVFISSIAGVTCSGIGNSMYSASKGAINGIIKGMALDLAPKNIRVNSVIPGMIETGFFKEGLISESQVAEDKNRYPLKRYGKPEEVAFAAIYLLSDAAGWVTGSNLLIDGGYTLL
ncbi:MAG: SDR family NAD(P)-dependent oxidoreductase [Bacteroidetes bacterium]|nr:SDR family NAD(P)-dependent oxidoreductase [Bacteroidota bacterium]